MEILKTDEIVKAVRGKALVGGENARITGISTDSRTTKHGDLFFALKGEKFDGHQFVAPALGAGAAGAVVSHGFQGYPDKKNFLIISVEDTTKALGDLAREYRNKLDARIVGITGSNGKTTTKEMTYHALSHFGPAVRPQKSFNNFIGVPLTIFEIERKHRYGVLEMGTNAPGEIRRLSEIGSPDVAVIVNVSKTHLEGLGSIEGVAREKGAILEHLRAGGAFVYNADNPWCVEIAGKFQGKAIGFGFSRQAHIRCTDAKKKDAGHAVTINGRLEMYLPVQGYHNIANCLASFAVCHALGHDIGDLRDVMASFQLPAMRIERQRIGDITVINDAYNANPESVRAALRYLGELNGGGRKVFVCGDMLELGQESPQLHREIGEEVARLNIDVLWTVGKRASDIAVAAKSKGMPSARVVSFDDVADIAPSEIQRLRQNDTVLIKGSRGMRMENVIERFKEYYTKRCDTVVSCKL